MPDPAPPPGIDVSKPSIARVYDYLLGGKDNFAADRALAEPGLAAMPELPESARANRAFLGRAVRYLAERGIRQFLDLGAGLPTQENVHQVAQAMAPESRVVYVDNDPIVLAHGRALLADNDQTTVIQADMREPETILAHPETRELIDFSRPVGVLFLAVLHFVPDDAEAARIVAAFADAAAPGSYLVISHLTDHPTVAAMKSPYEEAVSPLRGRSRAEVERLFRGLGLVGPGVVDARAWPGPDTDDLGGLGIGGVARKG